MKIKLLSFFSLTFKKSDIVNFLYFYIMQNFIFFFLNEFNLWFNLQIQEEISIMRSLKHAKLLQLAAAFESPREIVMVME